MRHRTWRGPQRGNAPSQKCRGDDDREPQLGPPGLLRVFLCKPRCYNAQICKQEGDSVNIRARLGWETGAAGRKGEIGVAETHGQKGGCGWHSRELGTCETMAVCLDMRMAIPRHSGSCSSNIWDEGKPGLVSASCRHQHRTRGGHKAHEPKEVDKNKHSASMHDLNTAPADTS